MLFKLVKKYDPVIHGAELLFYWNTDSMVYQNQIQEAVDAIVKTIHPISIVLFGSVAREGKVL